MNIFFVLILLLTPACSMQSLVTQKEFEEYKSMNEFDHAGIQGGFLFNREDIRNNNEDIKIIYSELNKLTSLYMTLDEDMIDYMWYMNSTSTGNPIIQTR